MDECIYIKIVKTKKLHQCFGCFKKIKKGEIAELSTHIIDDKIYSIYLCKDCIEHVNKYCNKCDHKCDDVDGFSQGYVRDCDYYKEVNKCI